MKANQVKPPDKKVEWKKCCVCSQPTIGYGRWGDKVTCSRMCEKIHSDDQRKELLDGQQEA